MSKISIKDLLGESKKGKRKSRKSKQSENVYFAKGWIHEDKNGKPYISCSIDEDCKLVIVDGDGNKHVVGPDEAFMIFQNKRRKGKNDGHFVLSYLPDQEDYEDDED